MVLAIVVAAAGGDKDAHLLRKCRGGRRAICRDAWASNDFALQNRDQPPANRGRLVLSEPPSAVRNYLSLSRGSLTGKKPGRKMGCP
jgi:hypothetical protein